MAGVRSDGRNFFLVVVDTNGDNGCAGPWDLENSTWINYTYHMDQVGRYGDSLRQNTNLPATRPSSEWQEIVIYMKLNTPDSHPSPSADGIQRMWINGELKLEHTDMRFRSEPASPEEILELNRFMVWSYMYGYSGDTQYQWVDDITIWQPGN